MTKPNSKRLKILSSTEIKELYGRPMFNKAEREAYFSLSKKEYVVMDSRGSLASKVHFILQLGYFKAIAQFFNCAPSESLDDVIFILDKYFENKMPPAAQVSNNTRQSNQSLIAKLLNYEIGKLSIKKKITCLLQTKIKQSSNPVDLFHEILSFSLEKKMRLLGYSTLQDLIGEAISNEEIKLGKLLQHHMDKQASLAIEKLLTIENDEYVLTALKKDPKNFSHKQMTGELKKLEDNKLLYQSAKRILKTLSLPNRTILYYAMVVMHYPINQIKTLSKSMQDLSLLCYVYCNQKKINDNLTVSFFHHLSKYKTTINANARDYIFSEKLKVNNDAENAAIVLEFFDDTTIPDKESFGKVRKRAYKHVAKGKYGIVSSYIRGVLFDYQKVKWDTASCLASKITKNLRPIFKSITLDSEYKKEPILLGIKFLNRYLSAIKSERNKLLRKAPKGWMPAPWREHVISQDNEDQVDIKKYEFMLYQQIAEKIESGHLHLPDAISFNSLSSHFVNDERWKNKDVLLKKLGNKKLLMSCDQVLDGLEEELESLLKELNKAIKENKADGIKINNKNGEITFTLPYPRSADRANHAIFGSVKTQSHF